MTPRIIFSFALLLSLSSVRSYADREQEELRFRDIASNTYTVLTNLGIEEIYPHAATRAHNLCFTDDYYDGGVYGLKLFAALTQKTPAYDKDALTCVKLKDQFLEKFRKKYWKEDDYNNEPRFRKAILEQYELQLTTAAQAIEHNIKSSARDSSPSTSTLKLSIREWTDLARLEIAPIQMLTLKEAARLSQNTSDFAALDDAADIVDILLWKNFTPAYAFTKQFLTAFMKFPGSSNYEVAHLDPDYFDAHFLDEERIHSQYKLKLRSTSLYRHFVTSSYADDAQKSQALKLAQEFKSNYEHSSSRLDSTALLLALMDAKFKNAFKVAFDLAQMMYADAKHYDDEEASQLFAALFINDYTESLKYIDGLLKRNENQDNLTRLYLFRALVAKKAQQYYENATNFLKAYEYGSGVHMSGIDVIATKVLLCASLVGENYSPVFRNGIHAINNTMRNPRFITEETREAAMVLARKLFDKKVISAERLAQVAKAMSI